ncbi:MAG: hypothetical protein AB7P49_07815 [Bdellovibrionales bacterium]
MFSIPSVISDEVCAPFLNLNRFLADEEWDPQTTPDFEIKDKEPEFRECLTREFQKNETRTNEKLKEQVRERLKLLFKLLNGGPEERGALGLEPLPAGASVQDLDLPLRAGDPTASQR